MAKGITLEALSQAIEKGIQAEADRLREALIVEAVADFERKLRDAVLKVTVRAADYYEHDRERGALVVRVMNREAAQ